MLKGKVFFPIFIFLLITLYVIKFPVVGSESLRMGLLMMEKGTLNIYPEYLFTISSNNHIVNPQWLYQIITALLYKLGGLTLFHLFFTVIITLNFILIYFIIYKLTQNIKFSSLLCLLTFIISIQFISYRAVMFALLLYLIILYLLKVKNKYFFFIPIIAAVWVNIHLSFPLIFVLLGIKALDIIKSSIKNNTNIQSLLNNKEFHYLLIITGISFLATLINPYHIKIWKEALVVFDHNTILNAITEWVPVTINETSGLIFFIFSFGIFYVVFTRKEKVLFLDLLLMICFYFFTLTSIRNIIWWSATVIPVSSIYLYRFICKTKLKDLFTTIQTNNRFINFSILFLIIVLIIFLSPFCRKYNIFLTSKLYPTCYSDNSFSKKLINFLLKNKSDKKSRIMIHSRDSNEYVFYLAPYYKFPTGELVGYFQKEINDYILISAGIYHYHELLDKYKINYLIVNVVDQYYLIKALLKDKKYKLILTDKREFLFEKVK